VIEKNKIKTKGELFVCLSVVRFMPNFDYK